MPLMNIQLEWMSNASSGLCINLCFFLIPLKFASWVACNKQANGNMITIPKSGGLKFKCFLLHVDCQTSFNSESG